MDSPLPGISPVIQIKSKTLMLANLRDSYREEGKIKEICPKCTTGLLYLTTNYGYDYIQTNRFQ
jgi:hypothetical protein